MSVHPKRACLQISFYHIIQRLAHRYRTLCDSNRSVIVVRTVEGYPVCMQGGTDIGVVETIVCVDENGISLGCQ